MGHDEDPPNEAAPKPPLSRARRLSKAVDAGARATCGLHAAAHHQPKGREGCGAVVARGATFSPLEP